jgi:hypothetical protein
MVLFDIVTKENETWLLDSNDPGPAYLALIVLSDLSQDDPRLVKAKKAAHQNGPINTILEKMHPDGYWEKEGPGYLPKYRSTVWSLITLAQLGANVEMDPRIQIACQYYLDQAFNPDGQISSNGPPSGTVDCLQGNMLSALLDLGIQDPRLDTAFEWMARSLTGEGVTPMSDKSAPLRYYSGKIGPDFECGANNKMSCAWGGVKVMLAFAKLPDQQRTSLIQEAIQRGVEFFFSADPSTAGYPNGWNPKPSGNWWKFGFPVYYVTDILQLTEALAKLGYAQDSRLVNAIQLIRDKADEDGRWSLDYGYSGKGWVDFGNKKMANKWVTIRALETLYLT